MKFNKLFIILLALAIFASALTACGFDKLSDETGETGSTTGDTDNTYPTFDYGIGLDDNGFIEGLKASDYVKNFEYKGVDIPESVFEFDQETYDAQVNAILGNYDFYTEIKDRAVEDNDTLNIDYVGYVDGVAFEGGDTMKRGTVVTIGVTNYIDDFLEQLIGHMPGETFDVNVTFPDPYQNNPELSNKDAVFKVTINYIHGPETPKLNDEIAADFGFKTVAELEEDLKKWVIQNSRFAYVNTLAESFEVTEVPQIAIDYIVNFYKAYYSYNASIYGVDLDAYVKSSFGYDTYSDFVSANKENIEDSALFYLRFQAIAELEGLTVTDEEMNESEYADSLNRFGAKYVKMLYLQEVEVVDFIFDNRQI